MALDDLQGKKRNKDLVAGLYLATIVDMYLLKDAEKNPIKIGGHLAVIVRFQIADKRIHDQLYVWDGGIKQNYFQNLLRAAQVDLSKGTPKKVDLMGKKLWIAIQEIHFINDDEPILNIDKTPKIDFHIFKVIIYIEGAKSLPPVIKGDPAKNNGIPSDMFITYKNESVDKPKEELGDVPSF